MVLRNFMRNRRGNVAMMFAVGVIPVFGMVGLAIDYSRLSNAREKIASAIDSAAISANKNPRRTLAQKTQIARSIIVNQLAESLWIEFDPNQITVADNNGLLDVTLPANVKTSFMQVLGIDTMTVSAAGQSLNRIENGAEIALVLDNTGSMRNDMDELKTSVNGFINSVMPMSGGQVKMGIVPYVAAVNPGPAAMNGLMDYSADAAWHAYHLENYAYIGSAACQFPPSPPSTGGGGPTGPTPPPFDPGTGGTDGGASAGDWLERFAAGAFDMFGIAPAEAQSIVTPNTIPPFVTTTVTNGPPQFVNTFNVQVPEGFRWNSEVVCALMGPKKISHFDLINRIPGASWKGCVEARREPFDVTDAAVDNSNADTRYVPYFWPDEPPGAKNDFMPDYPAVDPLGPLGFHPMGGLSREDTVTNIFKYNGTANGGSIQIDESGTDTLGPNKSCPDPIVPLTASTTTLTNAVDNLTYKEDGGTINSEGLMWGWRVLSPSAPFTEGSPYGQAKKYLVLMSDGKSEMLGNPVDSNLIYSDYSAYGYLGQYDTRLAIGNSMTWQPGESVRTFAEARTYLDERFALACQNAKDAGIVVFTILFRESDPTAKSLMESCASKPQYAFSAPNNASLNAAFQQVAGLLQNLRLTK